MDPGPFAPLDRNEIIRSLTTNPLIFHLD